MPDERKVPTELAVVALLFLILGIGSAVRIVFSVVSGDPQVEVGILGFAIFYGLRSFVRFWRRVAIVLTWLGIIGFPVGALMAFFGLFKAQVQPLFVAATGVPLFLIALWTRHVLTRPHIRALFQLRPVDRRRDVGLREQ